MRFVLFLTGFMAASFLLATNGVYATPETSHSITSPSQIQFSSNSYLSFSKRSMMAGDSKNVCNCSSSKFGVILQASEGPGGLGMIFAFTMVSLYFLSVTGSLITSIGNAVLYRDNNPRLLRDWGISGVVFGGISLVLGITYFALQTPISIAYDMSIPVLVLTLALALGGPAFGFGIHSIVRSMRIKTKTLSMDFVPWIARGTNQSIIGGISTIGVF